jgi:hypothetical protein
MIGIRSTLGSKGRSDRVDATGAARDRPDPKAAVIVTGAS